MMMMVMMRLYHSRSLLTFSVRVTDEKDRMMMMMTTMMMMTMMMMTTMMAMMMTTTMMTMMMMMMRSHLRSMLSFSCVCVLKTACEQRKKAGRW